MSIQKQALDPTEWLNGVNCEMDAALTVFMSYFGIDFAQLFHLQHFSLICIFGMNFSNFSDFEKNHNLKLLKMLVMFVFLYS